MNLPELKDGEHIVIQTPQPPAPIMRWLETMLRHYDAGRMNEHMLAAKMEQLRDLLKVLGVDET